MRLEHKYLLPLSALGRLREAIRPYMYPDPHGAGYEEVGYTVRSIYFDTWALRYYQEKKSGIQVRRKLRIRAYNRYEPGDWAFLEIKRKVGGHISKNRAPVIPSDLPMLFATGEVSPYVVAHPHYPKALEEANRFFYHLVRYNLRPMDQTVYEREAFLGQFDPTLRLTFDRNLRGRAFPRLDDLYGESGLYPVFPGQFILEVKFNTRFPGWLRALLGQLPIQHRAISKYCHCFDVDPKARTHKATLQHATSAFFQHHP